MRTNPIITGVLLCLLIAMSGCKKFVEKGNVNIDPNKPPFATLATLLPAVEYSTANNQGLLGYITTLFPQQMAAYSAGPINEDQNNEVRISSAFEGIYKDGITNSTLIIAMSKEQGAPHYTAIGRILLVTNLILATDTWGDVPLTDAIKAPAVLYPTYDSQQSIYEYMQKSLDSAIIESKAVNPTTLRPSIDDMIFAGDTSAWRRTAWLLKARLYMHTTKKGATAAAANALDALANGLLPTSKDYQLAFSERNPNPWFVNVSGRISGSATYTIGPAKRFVDALSGAAYPGLVDPRIDKLIFKRATASTYVGITNGLANTGNTTDLTDVTFFAQRGSPLLMGSYAEQKLMEAEARFLLNGGTTSSVGSTQEAYDAYIAGITASMSKLGVNGAAYLANPQVAAGAAGLTLEHILREKQVVLFLHPDAWADVRRYDYNEDLFAGMVLPERQNANMGGQFIRRAQLPLNELNRNPEAQEAVKPMTEKLWWDQ
ncbi:MAG: SusD/RagB family nutrient-binding outer membrane lipoprotein [Candidatus Pseudobacter hemicellulosilyticus]|uniref:SusD/RagB family nutrient-binding outer membrane lipoprotein n=1 Tax=Candidatus Pseudobacter hemicellulosilyticus TaxID=3121375 RepID=A0AAJ5WW58_9BACT|nr:MAG: SusD/RagB family nutrient-binding outer membrane lipoprotein [Pseudobacter sp.]